MMLSKNKYKVVIAGAQVHFLFFFALFACFALFVFLHFLSYSWRRKFFFIFVLLHFLCFLHFSTFASICIFSVFKFLHFCCFTLFCFFVLIAGAGQFMYFCTTLTKGHFKKKGQHIFLKKSTYTTILAIL